MLEAMAMRSPSPSPSHPSSHPLHPILIIGAGVFGLSTTLSLLHRHKTPPSPPVPTPPDFSSLSHILRYAPIHILDASPTLPNPSGSSVDSSRIIRPDYSSPVYSSLARSAQTHWRDQTPEGWGGQGRYTESGFVLTADHDDVADDQGMGRRYVEDALTNAKANAHAQAQSSNQHHDPGDLDGRKSMIEELPDRASIHHITGYSGALGDSGYVNWGSGWADAEACIEFALAKIRREDKEGRVKIECGKRVSKMIFEEQTTTTTSSTIDPHRNSKPTCTGVTLSNGTTLPCSFLILATGAWTPTLIDLHGRALATGQILAYLPLSEPEYDKLKTKPVLMSMTRGMFIIPPPPPQLLPSDGKPGRERELKIARHGFGYRNPQRMRRPALMQGGIHDKSDSANGRIDMIKEEGKVAAVAAADDDDDMIEISTPEISIPIPHEGEQACREMARQAFSTSSDAELRDLAERPVSHTRICWYCDTYVSSLLSFLLLDLNIRCVHACNIPFIIITVVIIISTKTHFPIPIIHSISPLLP
jgi:sarcosine oxidase / L-pipecolate oxidase